MENKKVREKLAAICSRSEKSIREVEDYLLKFDLKEREKAEIIDWLVKENFINENRLVENYVNEKIYRKGWGKLKVKNSLAQKGIDENLIDKVLSGFSKQEYKGILQELINKNLKIKRDKQKVYSFCLQRGFEEEIIEELLQDF